MDLSIINSILFKAPNLHRKKGFSWVTIIDWSSLVSTEHKPQYNNANGSRGTGNLPCVCSHSLSPLSFLYALAVSQCGLPCQRTNGAKFPVSLIAIWKLDSQSPSCSCCLHCITRNLEKTHIILDWLHLQHSTALLACQFGSHLEFLLDLTGNII